MLKSGNLYKLGEGPINYDWNIRYFVLDYNNQALTYYANDREAKARGMIVLTDALISQITEIKERAHSFSVQTSNQDRTIFLSCNTEDESNEWREAIIDASVQKKVHKAEASFKHRGLGNSNSLKQVNKAYLGEQEEQFLNDDSNFHDIKQFNRNTVSGAQNISVQMNMSYQHSPFKQAFGLSKIQGTPERGSPHEDQTQLHDSVDEQLETQRQLVKRTIYNKNKVSYKQDLGDIPAEQQLFLNTIQKYLQEDVHEIENNQHRWDIIEFKNGITISALNSKPHKITIDQKRAKTYLKNLAILVFGFYFISLLLWSLGFFWLGLAISALNYKKLSNIFIIESKFKLLKGRTVIKGEADYLAKQIISCYKDHFQDSFDFMAISVKLINEDLKQHTFITEETLELPNNSILNQFLDRRSMKVQTYYGADESGAHYILRKSINTQLSKTSQINNVQEAFVCVPFGNKSEKCALYFFSDFNYATQGNQMIMNNYVQDKIKLLRINILASFIETQRFELEKQMKDVLKIISKEDYKLNHPTLENDSSDEGARPQGISVFQRDNGYQTQQSKSYVEQGTIQLGQVDDSLQHRQESNIMRLDSNQGHKKIKENPTNIHLKIGQKMILSDRFPGYFRLESGALWCHNQEELDAQSGIFIELLQKAGKKLMEGRGMVAVSLPVRMFEKRSTLERICDLWCTGPLYLKKSALENNPIERLKYVITFVISGMHMIASQRKPFNPIIGETFEGVWPDGSPIFVEHVSHHPPISCFLVENVDNLYKFEGSYEYTAKIMEIGNSVLGRQVGKNRVRYNDGSEIEFEYPFMKISGLLFGKRTVQWVGSIDFVDRKNGIKATLTFSKEGGFFSRQTLPTDCFQGTILKNEQEVSKFQGSWLEFIRFDDKLYWELETSDTIRPQLVEKCLPSDCRYREDSIVFATGDMVHAQSEKERLEELQRRDRRMREEAAKRKNPNYKISH